MFELHVWFLESDGEWKYLASFSTRSVATSSVYLGVQTSRVHFNSFGYGTGGVEMQYRTEGKNFRCGSTGTDYPINSNTPSSVNQCPV
ncbi:hypothetical protein E2C01_042894 [Portunus trituberculatus]|uniref:Uncharacterized protein n=1 Tax=Portunus trituberculatus TaxID=210409 RepID=A0A5B7FN25_PORTR|nr:hypothetical protein [Portunus trituberculatus]